MVIRRHGDAARATGAVGGLLTLGAGDLAADGISAENDAAVRSARAGVVATRNYYLQRMGRRGLDGHDAPMAVLVHAVRREDWSELGSRYRLYFAGAFWDGRMAVLGEGLPPGVTLDGRTWTNAAAAVDLVAHELTHGVIDHSSRLVYRNESGSLNEAFADIMATAVEFFVQPAGDGPSQADYLAGEDAVSGGGLRSSENPGAFSLPDHHSLRDTSSADNGGVHTNSAIVSHGYYLAIEGGTNLTSGARVVGVGRANREQIEKSFYRAFVYLLPSGANFSTARAATIQSARDLYGVGSEPERAINEAWNAVGVK